MPDPTPARVLRLALLVGAALAAPLAADATPAIAKGDLRVELERVCEGLTSPVTATHAGDGSRRLFVVDQAGTIRVLDLRRGECLSEPFLDLTDRMVKLNPFFDERGVLGLAFHPDFERNGLFYVRYSGPREGGPRETCAFSDRGCHESILSEFRVRSRRGNTADPTSERIVFRTDQPNFIHNAGHVTFGPDGLLYFSLGDGGGNHDGLPPDHPDSKGTLGTGQDISNVLGSLLRIDVDRRDPGLEYAIPPDNPFAGETPGADEIYAYGFRNPYRFAFDTGRPPSRRARPARGFELYVADVGHQLYEEIDVVRRGGNYGWAITEGFHCFDPFEPSVSPLACPGTDPRGEPLRKPVAEYNHRDGKAVIGGYVYRGRRSAALYGKYVFGDFTRRFFPPSGRLFWLDADGVRSDIFELRIGADDAALERYVLGFGEDEHGELYVLTSQIGAPVGVTGEVWRLYGPDYDEHPRRRHDDDDD